jgi:ribosomal protein L16 Arg81 hydroxylase
VQSDDGVGQIGQVTIDKMRALMQEALLLDDDSVAEWLGKHLSTPQGDYAAGPEEVWDLDEVHERLQVRVQTLDSRWYSISQK